MAASRRALRYGLTANVVFLAIVSLLTDISSEMILPLLPFFLTQVLLADALIVGLIEGLGEGVVAFLKILSGRWSDIKGRRKRFVAAGGTAKGGHIELQGDHRQKVVNWLRGKGYTVEERA